jgi:hypothetical protein
MEQVITELSDEQAQQVRPYRGRLKELMLLGLSQVRIHEAPLLYSRGLVSFARAAELAGLSRPEMTCQACASGMHPRWSDDMVQDELA